MKQTELSGVIVPIITPVDDQDRVAEPAFRQVIRRLIEAGVHGLFIGGSAGEGPLLTAREWQRMVEIAFDEARGALPLLGGAIDTSTQRIKERIKILADVGYEYFVVTLTFTPRSKHRRALEVVRRVRGRQSWDVHDRL
jgi:4-hydroxy-tetrahydrodipicolinate synthase